MRWLVFCEMITFGLGLLSHSSAQSRDSVSQPMSASVQVEMQVMISKSSIPLNDSLRLDFCITCTGNHSSITISEPPIPEVSNLDITGSGSSNETTINESIKRYTYFLKPKTIGMAYIEPIRIEYQNLKTPSTQELWSKRLSISVTEAIIHEETSFSFALVLAILLAIVGGISFMIYKNKIKTHSMDTIQEQESINPYDQADSDLKQIVQEKIDNKSKIEKIHHLVLQYFRQQTQSDIGLPGREVVKVLRRLCLADTRIFDIQDFFDRCDLIKFSGSSITKTEVEELSIKARDILKVEINLNPTEEKK